MAQPRFKSFFSRGKGTSQTERRRKSEEEKPTTGAHELFLEYEGFLPPSSPRQPRPSTAGARGPDMYNAPSSQIASLKSSEETLRSSTVKYAKPRKSFSDLSHASDDTQPNSRKLPSRHKKGHFFFSRTIQNPSEEAKRKQPGFIPNHEEGEGSSTHATGRGWLWRRMNTNTKEILVAEVIANGDLPNYEDEDFTALPALPGYTIDSPKPKVSYPSGAAARAAVAAQNELLDSMRTLRIAETKVGTDSESGVGIDVRDNRGEVTTDLDIPVVRQSKRQDCELDRLLTLIDPLSVLPQELVGHILSYLDATSLLSAELVSHGWRQSANWQHVWKEVFRTEFQDTSQAATVAPRNNSGLGNAMFYQDWKNMWRARKALQQRWVDGYAAAVYLEGHTDSVYCVQFDEQKILTGSRDRTVRVWDARTYECLKVLGVPSRNAGPGVPPLPISTTDCGQRPFTTVFSPQSKNEPVSDLPAFYHNGSILCLQYDDKIMITGSSDCTLIVWDVKADYQPIKRLRHHTAGVLDVCFDDKRVVSCSKDATICLWDRAKGDFLRRLSGHRGPVNAVQLRGDLVVSASGDGVAKLWNLTSGLCIKEFPSKDRGMACVEFSPDSRTILAGGNDQVIYQFDTNTGELVREMKGHEGLVRSLHLDSASGRIVSGSYDTSVKVYDLKSGETIVNFTKWTTSWILSAKADYRRIIATSQDSRAVIMDFGYQLPGIESLKS